ncbi:MAG: cysteine desulfurase [Actinobacteria bacterium]|nr:cysteine desulfurase [Actinomycetota bacterium]
MVARTYFDHAASSPTLPEAVAAMTRVLGAAGNPSSLHASGRAARSVLEDARESLAGDLGAHPTEVVFTSGGTEANNLALLGARSDARPVLAVSAIEHPSVAAVRDRPGEVVVLPVAASGHLEVAAAGELVDERTGLVSVMWVNNETGAVQPVAEVVALAHDRGALAHSDGVQAFGHLAVDFAASGLNLLSVSAHKLGGPVGIGALLVRRGTVLRPSGFGGGQEARLRSGTVPVALAAGFAAASGAASVRLAAEAERLAGLRDRLLSGAVSAIPDVGVNTVGPCGPAIVNLTFRGARADDVLLLLDAAGFDASTGSACTAGVHQPSEVLLSMGRPLDEASSSLRFSFGPDTTAADVDALLAVLPGVVSRARSAA